MNVPMGIKKVALLVNGYVVGGAVRDFLLNKPVFDYDISTPMTPDEVKEVLKQNNYDVIPTGEKYGTISTFVDGIFLPVEITTFRSEKYNGTRFPEVAFHTSNQGDLMRRDFTINAMAYDPRNNEILDYNGGLNDIINKTIRFVGIPSERILEDPLRIIRACRIAVTLGFTIEPDSLSAIRNMAYKLKTISQERLLMEVKKSVPYFRNFIQILNESNLLKHTFGYSFEQTHLIRHDNRVSHYGETVFEHLLDALTRAQQKQWFSFPLQVALLFHDVGKTITMSEDNGIRHFINHEIESVNIFESTFGKFAGFDQNSKKQISFLIRNHMRFPELQKKRTIIRTVIDWKLQNIPFEWIENLTKLAFADRGMDYSNILKKIEIVWNTPRPNGKDFLKYESNKRTDMIRQAWIEKAHELSI